jgi:hypothetical protein
MAAQQNAHMQGATTHTTKVYSNNVANVILRNTSRRVQKETLWKYEKKYQKVSTSILGETDLKNSKKNQKKSVILKTQKKMEILAETEDICNTSLYS